MSVTLRLNPALWGFFPQYVNDRSTQSLNNANTWVGYGFMLHEAKTINKVRIYCTSSGSPVAADYRLELYSSTTANAPRPNASVQTATVPASVSNGAWLEWTGLSTALSANTMYWLVLKNLNATPGTNIWIPNFHDGGMYVAVGGGTGTNGWGWSRRLSTNAGSTWGTPTSPMPCSGVRLEFSDGSFEGLPLGGRGSINVYSSREAGAYFVSPDVALNVKGVSMPLFRTGTPTGTPQYRIYLGNTSSPVLQGTTGTLAAATILDTSINSSTYYTLFFSTPITIPASSVVRVVLSETTQSDASTNRYDAIKWDMENDANTKALLGTYQSTLSTDGGATFTETDTDIVPFGLILTTQAGTTSGGSEFSSAKYLPLHRYRRGHLNRI